MDDKWGTPMTFGKLHMFSLVKLARIKFQEHSHDDLQDFNDVDQI